MAVPGSQPARADALLKGGPPGDDRSWRRAHRQRRQRGGDVRHSLSGAYVTSKTALIRFTEILALEAAQHGVKVFAIEPGTVRTAMSEDALESEEGQRWLPWFGEVFQRAEDVPPDHAADLVVLLASGRADALSGRFFTIKDDIAGLIERVVPKALVTCRHYG